MNNERTDPTHRPWATAPACDSFAEILASSSVVASDNGTIIRLGCGSTLRLENVRLARIAAGFPASPPG